ncbi:MAG: hypothetical protein Q8S73_43930 [Deltaproteobacteria bacterium]|nr:hypothetical protein [Myxococcales bacterium]MDP3221114.1 hypothetical protein [Deltaproteobacteria bacterium]
MRWGVTVMFAVLVAGCERPRTELVLRVDTEVPWGEGQPLQSVVITVRRGGATGPLRSARTTALGTMPGRLRLPLYVGVIAGDDTDTPVWLEALGCADPNGCVAADATVSQRAVVRFVRGETQEVPLLLASACVGVICASDERCAAGGRCEPATAAQETLRPFVGNVLAVDRDATAMMEASTDVGAGEDVPAHDGSTDDRRMTSIGEDVPGDDGAERDASMDLGGLDDVPDDVTSTDLGLDSGVSDVPSAEIGLDVGAGETSVADAGAHDAGVADTGLRDTGPPDSGPRDAGPTDAGTTDAPTCALTPEVFNGRDDDCDGLIDEGFAFDGLSLACMGTGRTMLLSDSEVEDGGSTRNGDGLEVFCINGSARFCLTNEACPWRAGTPAVDDGRSCSSAGLDPRTYFMAYLTRGYIVISGRQLDLFYCPADGRVRVTLD